LEEESDVDMSFGDISHEEAEWNARAQMAKHVATLAFKRLLELAEKRDTGQTARVAKFLATTYIGQTCHFDVYDLRAVDIDISDDMLKCLDAIRWGKCDLHALVPDGALRMQAVCRLWGFVADS
jgi:hypothetical protein